MEMRAWRAYRRFIGLARLVIGCASVTKGSISCLSCDLVHGLVGGCASVTEGSTSCVSCPASQDLEVSAIFISNAFVLQYSNIN